MVVGRYATIDWDFGNNVVSWCPRTLLNKSDSRWMFFLLVLLSVGWFGMDRQAAVICLWNVSMIGDSFAHFNV